MKKTEGLREKIEEILSCDDYISASQVVEEKGLLWRMKPSWIKRTRKQLLSLFSDYIKQRKPEKEDKCPDGRKHDFNGHEEGSFCEHCMAGEEWCEGRNQGISDTVKKLLEGLK